MPRLVAVILICLAGAPAHGHAQRIIGRMVDPAAGPVVGAFVRLMDADGRYLRGALTDSAGRFILSVPAAGRYRIRGERIGYDAAEAGPIDVGPAETVTAELSSGVRAIALDGLRVESERRCTARPERAAGAARVWEEARKALEITLWAKENAAVRFRATSFRRELDPRLEVREQNLRRWIGASYRSFITADPDVLQEFGYARAFGDTTEYYGLDAEVLLSDHFLDGHCFELNESADRPDLIGVRFRPISDRGRPDLEGTLWVERATGLLRWVEYTWVGVESVQPAIARVVVPEEPGVPPVRMTGRSTFRRLDNGIWIVDDWWIRVPILGRDQDVFRLMGWNETGGIVLDAWVPGSVRTESFRPSRQ